jgi:hypothetical protein
MALEIMKIDNEKKKKGQTVKAELTPSYGVSVLESPTTSVQSGTKNSTVKTKSSKLKALSKKDLTKEEYYNPEEPTYKSGNFLVDFVAKNPYLIDAPFIGDFIKEKAYELGKQSNSAVRSIDDINLTLGAKPTEEQQYLLDLKKNNNLFMDYSGIDNPENSNQGVDLLRQYLFKDQNLTPSVYKPTSDYYEFLPSYSLKNKLGSNKSDSVLQSMFNFQPKYADSKAPFAKAINKGQDVLAGVNKKQSSDLESVIKTHNPVFYSDDTETPNIDLSLFYDKIPDLGHYKSAFGWDKDLNLPYASVSDAWDFYPKDYGKQWSSGKEKKEQDQRNTQAYQQSYLMHKAGDAYKIYDRVYIDPKTKKAIPDKQILKMKHKLK